MKRMRETDIPAFVQEVAATGCNICAIGPATTFLVMSMCRAVSAEGCTKS